MREPATRNHAQPEKVEQGPQANEPISAPLTAVHPAREALTGLAVRRKEIENRIIAIERKEDRRVVALAKEEEAFLQQQRDDLLAGIDSQPAPPQLQEKWRQSETTGRAARAAVESLRSDLVAIGEAEREAKTVFAGAVFDLTVQCQEAARQQILEYWRKLALPLSELMAIEDIRDRYCREGMKLSGIAERPWSGAVVANKLVDSIPERLRGPAIAKDCLRQQADRRVSELVRQIEGEAK